MRAVSHLWGATMRIPRTRTEQKIGPAWAEAAGGRQVNINKYYDRGLQPHPRPGPLTFNLHTPPAALPCSTIFATRCNRIPVSAKDSRDFKTKTKSFLCVLSVSYSETRLLRVSSQCLRKERSDHLFWAFSFIRGHLLFVMTRRCRFTVKREKWYKNKNYTLWNINEFFGSTVKYSKTSFGLLVERFISSWSIEFQEMRILYLREKIIAAASF